jgi:hypothetical protein
MIGVRLPATAFRAGLLLALLLSGLHLYAASQSKGNEQLAESGAPKVTVTLVRWPYT